MRVCLAGLFLSPVLSALGLCSALFLPLPWLHTTVIPSCSSTFPASPSQLLPTSPAPHSPRPGVRAQGAPLASFLFRGTWGITEVEQLSGGRVGTAGPGLWEPSEPSASSRPQPQVALGPHCPAGPSLRRPVCPPPPSPWAALTVVPTSSALSATCASLGQLPSPLSASVALPWEGVEQGGVGPSSDGSQPWPQIPALPLPTAVTWDEGLRPGRISFFTGDMGVTALPRGGGWLR